MRFIRTLTIIFALLFVLPHSARAQAQVRVLLLPFEMHSATDISGTRRQVMESLASSLDSEGARIVGLDEIREEVLKSGRKSFNDESAFRLSEKVPADFAVVGSIVRLGDAIDVDWHILDLKTKAIVGFYFKSSGAEWELLKKVGEAGAQVYVRMLASLKARPAVKSGVIDGITVIGNRRVDAEAVLKKVTSKTGAPFSPDDVKEDLRAIYATGYFDDVSADLSDRATGKVLTFIVKEMPFIKKISFRGNKELKDEKLKDSVTIKENTVLDRVLLGENAEKIKTQYSEEGYFNATVTPVIETDGLEASVIFDVNEGPEVKVKRITFIGNRYFSSSRLKGLMNTSEAGIFSFLTKSGKFNDFALQNDIAIIMSKYFDNGFIRADILEKRVLLSEDKKWFYITIALTEGEQFRVGSVDVKGEILPSTSKEDLLDKLKIKNGEIFSRSKLSKGIEAVTDVYGDKGYAYADIKPVTQVDPEKKTIDVTLDIKANDLVYIERIDITGNVRTRDKVVRRELELGEGDQYKSSELRRSRNNLKRLGYFEDVRINQTQGSASDRIKLDVNVRERPTGAISLGFGYSSVDKLIGTASVSQSNFMGTGVKLDLSGTVSSTSSKYVLGFTEPWLFDRPISAGADIYNTDRDYPGFKQTKNGFDLRLGFPIYDRVTRGFLTYKLEDVKISNVKDTASNLIKGQAGKSTESSLTAMARRDTRDDAFFPTDGEVLTASTQFSGGPLGGTSHFIKYEGDAVKFFALPWETTISFHGSVGFIQGYQGKTVPIFEKYYLGGLNSIRGFKTRTVSPKDPATGDLIGGNTMMTFNTEFLFPLFSEQAVKGLIFFDAGNSYKGRIDLADIRTGAGVGIRWFSPLGPLRLELGFNLNKREGESSKQWDFAIGTAF
ncbi:MAG: outer membrane protein assembly factor BamA [Deltaproteobacteria bacterium]|nr:outer membrane protein assembly factor BamA [Deltaproteobacteria bacterium]